MLTYTAKISAAVMLIFYFRPPNEQPPYRSFRNSGCLDIYSIGQQLGQTASGRSIQNAGLHAMRSTCR